MNAIKWPQGPLTDPQTGQMSLEWFMFMQNLFKGFNYLQTQLSAQAGFASVVLNMAEEEGAEQMMSGIPGQQGPAGIQGIRGVPGMDGQDGEELALSVIGVNSGGVASFGPSAVTSITVKNGIITAIS